MFTTEDVDSIRGSDHEEDRVALGDPLMSDAESLNSGEAEEVDVDGEGIRLGACEFRFTGLIFEIPSHESQKSLPWSSCIRFQFVRRTQTLAILVISLCWVCL